MATIDCSECGAGLAVPVDVIVGELVSCKDCGSEYEVSQISPVGPTLKPAEEVGEDWGE